MDSTPPPRPQDISPDGRTILYSIAPGGIPDIWTAPLDLTDPERPQAGKPDVFLRTPIVEVDARFSPDGRWIAYTSYESGGEEIFVRPFPAGSNGGGKFHVSSAGGKFPMWSRTDRRLYFLTLDNRIACVEYTARGENFEVSRPQSWSEQPILRDGVFRPFDINPDGKRFVAPPAPKDDPGQRFGVHVQVVLNFFEELKRRLP